VFVGNVNESFPQYVHLNGIYTIQPSSPFDGRPTYKHETRGLFLYYLTPTQHSPERWVVGPEVGSTDVVLSSLGPDVASRKWNIWLRESHMWTSAKIFKSVCVGREFVTCTSGRLELRGDFNASRHKKQVKRLGVYHITSKTNEMRPIYVNNRSDEFIYYRSGMWIVGPDVTKTSGGMFVLDGAWRPEYIVNDWIVQSVQGRPYQAAESSVKLLCQMKCL